MKWNNAFNSERYDIPNAPGIYLITSPSGRYYVGSAMDLKERLRSHSKRLKSDEHDNPLLLNSYRKHGKLTFTPIKTFKFVGLSRVQISEHLLKEEQKILDAVKGCKYCMNMNFKAAIPPDCSVPIVSIDEDGNRRIFPSSVKAAIYHNVLSQSICAVLKGKVKTAGNVTFFYEKADSSDWKRRFVSKTQKKKIKSISFSGETHIFPSINEAARVLGLHNQSIGRVLLGKIKQTKGHKFEYL